MYSVPELLKSSVGAMLKWMRRVVWYVTCESGWMDGSMDGCGWLKSIGVGSRNLN